MKGASLKRRAPSPTSALDRGLPDPLHRQLVAALRRAMETGELPPGAILPSSRALAEALGLSRNTVVTAYEELAAEDLLVSRAGAAMQAQHSNHRLQLHRQP